MKKILYIMMMALAVAFTACDDDFAYPPVSLGDIQGEGTKDSPYNIAAAIRAAARNGETSDEFVYVEGYVVSGSIDTSYGNGSFDLYDTPDGSGQKFICYRIKGFNNQKFTDENQIKVGDKIIVYAPVINYKGNTPETGSGGYLYAINGVVGSDTPDEPATPSDPKGDGTAESPYNIAKAIEVAKANGETSDVMVYVEGYVASGSIDTGYGNATFDLTDSENGAGAKFIAYRIKDFDNQKFTDANKIKKGDKIVIYAPIINYKGNTPETGSGGYLISINGEGPGNTPGPVEPGTPAGEGTAESPYNIAKAIEVAQANGETSETMVYVEGYVGSSVIDTGQYGNGTFDLYDNADATGAKFIAYRIKDFDNQKFTDANKVKVGDKIVVYGPVINYKGNTPETGSGAYLYSINGQTGGGETPGPGPEPGNGQGSEESPYTVSDVIAGATGTDVWVKGYIVGWVDGQVLSSGAQFNGNASSKTNLLIADDANVTDVANCIPVQLPNGDVRTALNLQDNPENYKKEVMLKGNLEKYFGTAGLKGVSAYKIDGQSGGGDDPVTPPTGDTVYSGLTANMDDWTIVNTNLPSTLDYVWSWKVYNNSGYLNASAYKDGANAAEAYAYTTIDLTGCSSAKLTFDHAAKFQTTLRDLCALVVRVQGDNEWTTLSIPTWPEAGAWTFVNSGEINLNAYAGKKVEIGFVYGSSASGADTWEIKNFIVSK